MQEFWGRLVSWASGLQARWPEFHAQLMSYQDELHWMMRGVSPFALYAGGIAVVALVLFLLTKWKEFMMIGVTAGIYVIPFLMSPGPVH